MSIYESACLGKESSTVHWTSKDTKYPFRLVIEDDENSTEITFTKEEARDLAVFLVKYLYEYVED